MPDGEPFTARQTYDLLARIVDRADNTAASLQLRAALDELDNLRREVVHLRMAADVAALMNQGIEDG